MTKVYLKVPTKEEMKYRKEWMMDHDTMNYNAGYDLEINGYDYETGTIKKTDEELEKWYDKWVNVEDKYFAYITDSNTNEYVGEIYFYNTPDINAYSMGIIITAKNRGKGYGFDALLELEKIAFEKYKINALSDMIPIDRIGAIKTFKKAGFINTDLTQTRLKFDKEETSIQLLLTKERYLKNNKIK